jgi:hypothetical protein
VPQYYDSWSDNQHGYQVINGIGSIYSMDKLHKGMIDILSGIKLNAVRLHQFTQNGIQYNLWIAYFWNFPLNIFGTQLAMVNCNTETSEI